MALQTSSVDTTWLAVGVLVTASGIIGSFIFSIIADIRTRQSRLMEMVQSFSKQLSDLTNKEGSLKSKADCESYAMNYLDIVDGIAFLYRQNSISATLVDFFENNFSYGLTIYKWLIENGIQNKERDPEKAWWNDLLDYCKKYGVEKYEPDQLPYSMQNYANLPEIFLEQN